MYKNIFKPRKSMLVHLLSLSSNCHLTFSFLFFIASDITFITFSFYLFPFLSISLIYVMTCLNIFSHPSKLVIFYFNPCKKKKKFASSLQILIHLFCLYRQYPLHKRW